MKYKLKYLLLLILPVMVVAGCHKTATPAEETLSVKLSAAAIETIPSSSFPLTVTVQSKMPAAGVTIKVDAKREDNNAAVYNVQASSTFAANNFTISPLPPGQIYCLATITVTSVTTPSNVWTGSFRVVWK